jgi:histidinol-phosphatase (PHP family)
MSLVDLHVHTNYCDGKDSPEEVVLSAIEKGLSTIGLLAHSYTPFDEPACIALDKIDEFVNEVNRLKVKYADKIKVLCGVEQDYYSTTPTDCFDYVIGSVHYLYKDGEYLSVDETEELTVKAVKEHFNGDWYAFTSAYFIAVKNVVKRTGADIIGHFDLVRKFNEGNKYFDIDDERYLATAFEAIDALVKENKPFEINTGRLKSGKAQEPYPSQKLVEYILDKGGKFVLSSDAHDKDGLAYSFIKYQDLVKDKN